jgi:double-stranded uracil-DNA glycosylase
MLPDLLVPDLAVVFVGTSVSDRSADRGHYYAHPTNRFWDLLAVTGLIANGPLTSEDDRTITTHGVGLTDLVKVRAASSDRWLSAGDFDVPGFLERLDRVAPRIVAFNGRKAAECVARHLGHPVPPEGPVPWRVGGAAAYRLRSSSGASSREPYEVKREAWRCFGDWVRATV